MKGLICLIQHVRESIVSRFFRYTMTKVDDLPDALRRKTIYIAGEGDHLWYAAMVCPCGCGAILQLCLMDGQRPKWSVEEHDDGTISLYPSIWRKVGCKSHFWIKRGKIVWCRKS
jgi:hypothetical protein